MAGGRPRSFSTMKHTGIVLTEELLEQLRISATANKIGVSAEIRRRLEHSFGHTPPPSDLVTRVERIEAYLGLDNLK